MLPFVVDGLCTTMQTLALLLRLLALSGMAKLELPRLLLTSGMSRLLFSRWLLSQTTSCNLCHFWIWVFWFFITSSQWSLPVPRANMKPPRTVNPRGLSAKSIVFVFWYSFISFRGPKVHFSSTCVFILKKWIFGAHNVLSK